MRAVQLDSRIVRTQKLSTGDLQNVKPSGSFFQLYHQSITATMPGRKSIGFTGIRLHVRNFNVGTDCQTMTKHGQYGCVDIDLTFPVDALILQQEILGDPNFVQAVASCQADHTFGNSAGYHKDAVGTTQPLSPCGLGVCERQSGDLIIIDRQHRENGIDSYRQQ